MARIEAPSARQILEELNVAPVTVGAEDAAGVQRKINQALEVIVPKVNEAIDNASAPYDFPFDEATLRSAYPTKTDAEIAEKLAGQAAAAQEWITFAVVVRMLGRVVHTSSPGVRSPYEARLATAKEQRDEAKEFILSLAAAVTSQAGTIGSDSGEENAQFAAEQSARHMGGTVATEVIW
jgi:hypothetical protein